jgi:hypothetical protein
MRAAQKYAQAGKDWVVDLGSTKFYEKHLRLKVNAAKSGAGRVSRTQVRGLSIGLREADGSSAGECRAL